VGGLCREDGVHVVVEVKDEGFRGRLLKPFQVAFNACL